MRDSRRRKEKGIKLSKQIIAENHLNLGNEPDILMQEAQKVLNKITDTLKTHYNETIKANEKDRTVRMLKEKRVAYKANSPQTF